MIQVSVTLDPAFTVASVPSRLFGVFVEHMGRCVYQGMYEPDDPHADAIGLRKDVVELTRELGATVVRYPGGNFVSGYRWEDGVGPRGSRRSRLDLAWQALEPNTFGFDEFMEWIGRVGATSMMAINLGTRGVEAAVNLLEYANRPVGSEYADLRAAHGHPEPYGIQLWCLGNEMDGPWQIGHKTADEYGRLAAETAKAMRRVDPSIELAVCGSSHERMPTFGTWESTVLEHTYDHVDLVSLHGYYEKTADDRAGYLASGDVMDEFIRGVVATCDHVAARRRIKRPMMLSFDEWNLEPRAEADDRLWTIGRRISEDSYNVEDAVAVGGLLVSLLRNSDRVAIACLAQLVNVMAPIRTEPGIPAWRQTIFHPFALTARHARGEVLRVEPRSRERVATATRGDVAPVDAVATFDPENGAISLFAVNRSPSDSVLLRAELRGSSEWRVIEHAVLGGREWERTNTAAEPNRVRPEASRRHRLDGPQLDVELPPASWTMLRLACPGPEEALINGPSSGSGSVG